MGINKKDVKICKICGNNFHPYTRSKIESLERPHVIFDQYCSKKCCSQGQITKVDVKCGWCEKEIKILPSELKKSKSGNSFCNRSCSAKYNNTHKTTGTRRSKFEVWVENKLKEDYPNLNFLFNNKETINSELDIYIENFKLAIELNGIFHYEPIYGEEKLGQIQNNDTRKFQACLEKGIELLIIDMSKFTYFKEVKAMPYYEIIKNVIDKKLQN